MKWVYQYLFMNTEYSPHQKKEDAINEAKLKSINKWDKDISRERIHTP